MNMKNQIIRSVVIWLILALVAAPVFSQSETDNGAINNLRHQLGQVRDLLDRAKDIVRSSNNPIAERALIEAMKLWENARDNFDRGRYRIAAFLCRQAGEKAKAALSAARMAEQYEGAVVRRLERAGELLDRAKEAIASDDRQNLHAIYESARHNLDRAWEFYRSRIYKPALKLANQVEKTAEKIISASRDRIRIEEKFQRQLEKVNQLVEQARMTVADCDREAARHLLQQAEKSFGIAQEMEREHKPKAALQALKRARQMAIEAIRECQGMEQMLRRHERLRTQADRLSDMISPGSGASGDAARKLIRQAYEQLDLAREHIDKNQVEQAAASLKAAQLALSRAERHISNHQ